MRKTLLFGLIAASLGFTACSIEDDAILEDKAQETDVVLNVTVEQEIDTRATIDGSSDVWHFAYSDGDEIKVSNAEVFPTNYTFTKNGATYNSSGVLPARAPVPWYAFFPSENVDLTNQTGNLKDIAKLYALAGMTDIPVQFGVLNITMHSNVAILKLDNRKGNIDIQVKNSATTFVSGLEANCNYDKAWFDVTTSTEAQTLFTTTEKGLYYIAVPAGVQISVKDGDTTIRSTGTAGLTAGKYYYLPITAPHTFGTGTAKRSGDIDVDWVQLWENGPKFAEYNVGAPNNRRFEYGGYYTWGGTQDKVKGPNYWVKGGTDLSSDHDTATQLWGSNWRTPTSSEYEDLFKCNIEYIKADPYHAYVKLTGKDDYSSNSIVLPCAGYYSISEKDYKNEGFHIYYWTSTQLNETNYNNYAWTFLYRPNGWCWPLRQPYDFCCPVRAVLAE